jgi:hypothetical protein
MLVSDIAHSVVCYNKNQQDSIDPVIPIGLKTQSELRRDYEQSRGFFRKAQNEALALGG